jgi:uncharacterized protein YndB with AHSA1/START domain
LHYDPDEAIEEGVGMQHPEPTDREGSQQQERVEREVLLPASREEAWQALTDPEQVEEWLADEAEFDLRPGGDLAMRTNGEEREGFFELIEEPSRLVFWWGEPGGDLARVEVDLAELEDGTHVRVVESRPVVTVDAFGIGIESESGGASPQMSAVAIAG